MLFRILFILALMFSPAFAEEQPVVIIAPGYITGGSASQLADDTQQLIAQAVAQLESLKASGNAAQITAVKAHLASVSQSVAQSRDAVRPTKDNLLTILTNSTPDRDEAINFQMTPGGNQLAPGLHVHVLDGMIRISNQGGSQNFSAGQFGYTASFIKPPVIVPNNPGLQFNPPPSFSSSSGNQSGMGSKNQAVDCEVR